MKQNKLKKCRECGSEFSPFNTTQKVCSSSCAIKFTQKQSKNDFKKEARRSKKKMLDNDKRHQIKLAQQAFNSFVRERDKNEPCISCGRHHNGQSHAGHYLTVGANPELRFHPFNNNKQCAPCNNHLSGNIVKYRPNLIEKIGLKNVDWIEGPHKLQKLTIDDIKEIKAYYKEQLKLLRAHNAFFYWQDGLGND